MHRSILLALKELIENEEPREIFADLIIQNCVA